MSICKEKIKTEFLELWKQRKCTQIEKKIDKLLAGYKIISNEVNQQLEINKLIAAFINSKRIDGLAAKSLKNYNYTLNRFVRSLSQEYNVNDITADEIREHISYLITEKQVKEKTLASNIGTLNSFFQWLVVEDVITKNPMLKIKPIKIDKKKGRKSLTIEELEMLRNACLTLREKVIVEFLVKTGLRLDEALQIDIRDINFLERSIKVIGKGNKERVVYFNIRAKLFIEDYINQRNGESYALFTSSIHPYQGLKSGSIQYILKNLGIRAKLKKNLHPHLLRHTFATHALKAGMDIIFIQQLMGHSEPATTQIYAKLDESSVKYAYDKIA